MKKLITSVLVGVMAVGMAVPSFAATYETIDISGRCRDTYCSATADHNSTLDSISVDIDVLDRYKNFITSQWATGRNTSQVTKDYTYSTSVKNKGVQYISVTGEGQDGRDRYTSGDAVVFTKR